MTAVAKRAAYPQGTLEQFFDEYSSQAFVDINTGVRRNYDVEFSKAFVDRMIADAKKFLDVGGWDIMKRVMVKRDKAPHVTFWDAARAFWKARQSSSPLHESISELEYWPKEEAHELRLLAKRFGPMKWRAPRFPNYIVYPER